MEYSEANATRDGHLSPRVGVYRRNGVTGPTARLGRRGHDDQVGAPGQIPSDCHTGTGCAIEATGGQVRVRALPPNAFSDVLALYVAYPTFEPLDVREHIAEYGASWVVSRKEGS